MIKLRSTTYVLTLLMASIAISVCDAQIVSLYASGLEGPRGLKFGPDGNLYVAEAGHGGPIASAAIAGCQQVPPPVGPYHGGPSARISKVAGVGNRVTVVDGLPSGMSSLPSGDTQGVADVAFLGDNFLAVLSGGGCSHGNPNAPNGVIRVDEKTGGWTYVDNLSAFLRAYPGAHPDPADYEPDGTPFNMIVHDGHFYIVEANHGELIQVNLGGRTQLLTDFSATQGHIVPTTVVFHNGVFYVGTLSTFPIVPGAARIYRVSGKGEILGFMDGFTTITGLAFDNKDRLYVLELSAAPGFPTPGAGKIVRVSAGGQIQDFLTGLVVPTGLTIGPDNALYVSNFGAAPPGLGQILRISIPD